MKVYKNKNKLNINLQRNKKKKFAKYITKQSKYEDIGKNKKKKP